MLNYDLSNVTPRKPVAASGFVAIPSGGYVCTIVRARLGKTNRGNDALYLVYDIAEGEFAGYFSSDRFASPDRDNKHQAVIVFSGDERQLENAKYNLEVISECNSTPYQRFDAVGSALSEHPEHFVGKRVGLLLQERITQSADGRVWHDVNVPLDAFTSVDDIRSGNFVVPPVLDERGGQQRKAPQPTVADDLPF